MTHLARSQKIIANTETHLVIDETASHAIIVKTSVHQLQNRADKTLTLDELEKTFRNPTDIHEPPTNLIVIKNAHNHSINQPLPPSYLAAIAAIARHHNMPLHVDKTRFFNASVTLNMSPRELAASIDSVAYCLSKKLAYPIKSLIIGDHAFITRTQRAQKLINKKMRQTNIVTATKLIALTNNPDKMINQLKKNHHNAKQLTKTITTMPNIVNPNGITQPKNKHLNPEQIQTNFILFRIKHDRQDFLKTLHASNVLINEYPHGQIQTVTHHNITGSDVETTISAVSSTLESTTQQSATDSVATGHLQNV